MAVTKGQERATNLTSGQATCRSCGLNFAAVLTNGRCPQCQTYAPVEDWGSPPYGPIVGAWYSWLQDPRKVLIIIMVLAIMAMILIGVVVAKY